jgi:hypothetical protein
LSPCLTPNCVGGKSLNVSSILTQDLLTAYIRTDDGRRTTDDGRKVMTIAHMA